MPNTDSDGLDEAFLGFGEDPAPVTPPTADSATPPPEPPKDDPKGGDDANKDKPTNSPDSTPKPSEEEPTPGAGDKPADPAEKPGEGTPPESTAPTAPETPQPLTKDDVQEVVSSLLNNERNSSKELETIANEVIEAYYPDGLSNVLTDEQSGKELRTPQDVVDVTNGEMPLDKAAQWLMNEQYKLDQQVAKIRNDAKDIAETTVNFRRDSMTVLQKYDPLFKWQPHLQKKAFDLMMKQVKVDKDKGVILSAPDVIDLYDTYLEPYQQAYVFANNKPATNPTPPPGGEPPKPSAEDRMDESGDGTPGGVPDDPNDFAQQVSKELAKPL